ncbi:hypothetical protein ND856_19350 [Leptospira bandrabouensis]|uniref:tetratricopeptide repeat protein n=1 Tax=Leptospira bandrabouensis TaxID=2484903 RepID=UPI00223CFFDF|nr:tetratricopeptide repeat protein [Leptospira bandrabouensis]MCW7479465.1 hypothetical protein [Leptospira bandrabouensis]MCW7487148.1 hypothetical protein [Leptospira bandrabouensis]
MKNKLISIFILYATFLSCLNQKVDKKERETVIDISKTDTFLNCKQFGIYPITTIYNLKTFANEIKINSKTIDYYKCSCSLLNFISLYSEAEIECSIGLQVSNDINLLNERYQIYIQLKKFELAESDLNEIINNFKNNTNPMNFYNRSIVRKKLLKLTDSLDDINRAIELKSDPTYYRNRALILIQLNRTKEACEDLKKIQNMTDYFHSYRNNNNDLFNKHCNNL